MNHLKITTSWGTNLYSFKLSEGLKLPIEIKAFNKTQAVRSVEGRWSDCPNINIAVRIREVLNGSRF